MYKYITSQSLISILSGYAEYENNISESLKGALKELLIRDDIEPLPVCYIRDLSYVLWVKSKIEHYRNMAIVSIANNNLGEYEENCRLVDKNKRLLDLVAEYTSGIIVDNKLIGYLHYKMLDK